MNLGFRRAIFLISSVAIVVVLWCVYLGGDPVGIERLMPSSSSVLNLVAVGVVSLFLFSAIVALAGYKLIHFSNPKVIPAPYFSLCGATVIAVVYTDYSWDLAWIFIGYVAIGISSLVIVEVYNSEFWFRRSSGDVRVVERPIHDPEEDTFGYAGRARVLARRILAKQDPLLIVGSYGAGKTSLANLIYFLLDGNGKEELDGKRLRKRGKWNRPKGPGWHLVKVKGWGKGSPESRARAIVSEILDEMLVWVDVVMVREYFTGYIEELFGQKGNVYSGLFKARRPDYNHLAWYLGEVLALTDSHILVVLDDFERNAEVGPMGARWHDGVSEVIDSLREIHRLHIVVCVDSAALRGLDQYRLFCSHEILPNLNADVVEGRILSLYQKLIDKAVSANVLWAEGDSPDIPNGSDRHFHLEESGKSYLWNTSVSNVLCTPRIVCFYERAVERSWSVLQGEVDLIDIMVFEAIKCRLPRSSIEVFGLMYRAVELKASLDSGVSDRSAYTGALDHIQLDLKRVVAEEMGSDGSVEMGQLIVSYVSDRFYRPVAIQSAVKSIRRSVYWHRVLSGFIPDDEPRDQEVLRDIRDSANPGKIEEMAAKWGGGERYKAVLNHFMRRLAADSKAFSSLFAILLRRDLSNVISNGEYYRIKQCQDLFEFWRINYPESDPDNTDGEDALLLELARGVDSFEDWRDRKARVRWVSARIRDLLDVSIPAAVDFLRLALRPGDPIAVIRAVDVAHIRTLIYKYCKEELICADAIMKRVQKGHIDCLYRLMFSSGNKGHNSPSDWQWIGGLLMEMLSSNISRYQPMMLLVFGRLVSRTVGVDNIWIFDRTRAVEMVGSDRIETLCELLTREVPPEVPLSSSDARVLLSIKESIRGAGANPVQ